MTQDATVLDMAHAAMEATPEDDAARLRFYERLADGELFLLLESEAEGDNITPKILETQGDSYVLVFDRPERLSAFSGGIAPYAALSGRVVASLLAGQGIGLGVNLGVADSAILIPAEAVEWLHDTLGHAPEAVEARPVRFDAPKGLPEVVVTALDTKLALAVGLATCAYLVDVTYDTGAKAHLLGFVDVIDGAESALTTAAREALVFSGIEAGAIDVGFFRANEPAVEAMARCGLRFDLPVPTEAGSYQRAAPGSDPDKPPKLR